MASSDVDHWQCDKTLPQCMEYMLDNQVACDVTFIVGAERETVHAHRFMLISRSPLFHAMLEGPLAEKGMIELPDVEKETFEEFLRYRAQNWFCRSLINKCVLKLLQLSSLTIITFIK